MLAHGPGHRRVTRERVRLRVALVAQVRRAPGGHGLRNQLSRVPVQNNEPRAACAQAAIQVREALQQEAHAARAYGAGGDDVGVEAKDGKDCIGAMLRSVQERWVVVKAQALRDVTVRGRCRRRTAQSIAAALAAAVHIESIETTTGGIAVSAWPRCKGDIVWLFAHA